MRLIADPKLDFKDVLIVPKRSTLKSRREVSLEKTYRFRNSEREWTGIPIIAANMDGVGTLEMAKTLEVPFKGPVAPTIQDLLGGLRSACTYTGSKNLKELPKRTTFIQVNRQIETLYGLGEL